MEEALDRLHELNGLGSFIPTYAKPRAYGSRQDHRGHYNYIRHGALPHESRP